MSKKTIRATAVVPISVTGAEGEVTVVGEFSPPPVLGAQPGPATISGGTATFSATVEAQEKLRFEVKSVTGKNGRIYVVRGSSEVEVPVLSVQVRFGPQMKKFDLAIRLRGAQEGEVMADIRFQKSEQRLERLETFGWRAINGGIDREGLCKMEKDGQRKPLKRLPQRKILEVGILSVKHGSADYVLADEGKVWELSSQPDLDFFPLRREQ